MLYVDGYVYIHFVANNNVNKILNYFLYSWNIKKRALNVKIPEVTLLMWGKKMMDRRTESDES